MVRSSTLSWKISLNLPGFQVLLRVSGGAGGRGEEDLVHGLLQLRADRGDPKVAGHKRANPDRLEAVEDGAWAVGGSRRVQVGGKIIAQKCSSSIVQSVPYVHVHVH